MTAQLLRGAIASPRHKLAAAEPHQIDAAVSVPPQFIRIPKTLHMWGNDTLGDCVTAEEAFAKATNDPEIDISTMEVIAWAEAFGFANGANLTDVMDKMASIGFPALSLSHLSKRYLDGPYNSVNWHDSDILKSAIYTGPVKIGIAADQVQTAYTAGNGKNGWLGVDFKPDTNEDHCVSLCGYGSLAWLANQLGVILPGAVDGTKPGYGLFTWSTIGIIDEPSMLAITGEAWLRNPTTIIK